MRHAVTIATTIVLLATGVAWSPLGCTMVDRSAARVSVDRLLGVWRTEDDVRLELRKDWTFTVFRPATNDAPAGSVNGRWFADETVVEFKNDGDEPVCPGVPGLYRWAIDAEGTLRFTLIADDCPPRSGALGRAWSRL